MLEGTQIGRFRVLSELGHGGMGTVYRAEDPIIGRTVAIKVVRLDDVGSPEMQRHLAQSFLREIHTAGVLQHPGIVSIYDAGKQDNMAYIVMELVPGSTFEAMLSASPRPPLPALLDVCRQASAALDYAHAHGVIHRDIKPSNILVQPGGAAKIVDFGIAKAAQASTMILSQTGTTLGTPDYMSPEQVMGKPLDGRTDQWSLAVVAYTALTGLRPFAGEHFTQVMGRIMNDAPRPPSALNPAVSPAADAVMAQSLAKDPAQRFPSCSAFMAALGEAYAAPSRENVTVTMVTPRTPPPLPVQEAPPSPPPQRKTLRWVVGVAAALAVLGGAAVAWRMGQSPPSAPAPGEPAPQVAAPQTRAPRPRKTSPNKPAPAASAGPAAAREIRTHTVQLVSTPDADIVVDDKPESACHSPCSLTLAAGSHTVRATRAGYYPLQAGIDVQSDGQQIPLNLEQATGSLMIKTDPQGATISADGTVLGSLTATTIHLAMGHHTIVLAKDGFAPYSFEVTVEDSLVHTMSVTLAPAH